MALNLYKSKMIDNTPLTNVQLIMFRIAAISRWIFALRMFDPSVDKQGYVLLKGEKVGKPGLGLAKLSKFGVVGSTASYVTYFALIVRLVVF